MLLPRAVGISGREPYPEDHFVTLANLRWLLAGSLLVGMVAIWGCGGGSEAAIKFNNQVTGINDEVERAGMALINPMIHILRGEQPKMESLKQARQEMLRVSKEVIEHMKEV